ncbi:MAG: beta-lactamase family protein [Ilumatobacteraceae bacterium]|nr:beta-lactamase family protein [Ilumatobacteraceae bacterium]
MRTVVALLTVGGLLLVGCADDEQAEPTPATSAPTIPTTPTDDLAGRVRALVDGDLRELSGAVLVAVEGEPVVELAAGTDAASGEPLTTSSRFRLGSITKQITAAAVMLLVDRGLVDPTDSVCDHLPACPPAWQPVTIEMAVAHTSGIPSYTDLPTFDPMTGGSGAPAIGDERHGVRLWRRRCRRRMGDRRRARG